MALTVETGEGLSDADSYISVADADTYNTNHSNSADWIGASTADKEKALRLATQSLNLKYRSRWKGLKVEQVNALDWPRTGVQDGSGFAVESDSIPQNILDAECELALREVQGDELIADRSKTGSEKKTLIKAGPITKAVEYVGGSSKQKQWPIVDLLVQQYIDASGNLERA